MLNKQMQSFGKTDMYLAVLSIVLIVMATLGLQIFKKKEWKEDEQHVVDRNEKMLHSSLGVGVGILMFSIFRKMIGLKSFVVFGVVIMIISVYTIKQYESITDPACKEAINTNYNYMYTLTGLGSSMILFGMLDWYMGGISLPSKNDELLLGVGCLIVVFIASVSLDTSRRSKVEDPYKMLMVALLVLAILVICVLMYLKIKKPGAIRFSFHDDDSSSMSSSF